MSIVAPFARPLYVMAKPIGSLCNQQCTYCYYLEKQKLYASSSFLMDDLTLQTYIRQYIEAQTQPQVLFIWHGGEPLLRPLSFYKRVTELQKAYTDRGYIIDNSLQTNGTRLNDEWCEFFREHNWLIGISIDGPQELHDHYRHMRDGAPSFPQVMHGIQLLKKHGVEWNIMGVVNDSNADHPLDVYHFYKETGCKYIQFTPIVEQDRQTGELQPFSVRPGQYAHFCCTIFDEWVRHDVGQVFVQLFDSTLACWVGEAPSLCAMWPTCGHAAVIEHNGDVYSCDHFVDADHLLGNIRHDTITSMMYSRRQVQFGRDKHDLLPRQCKECQWRFACNGGCPKDCICHTEQGEPGLNYLCQDYRQFFAHVAPYMDFMKNELLNQRAPANVMQYV
jgi:uncharacterized protein